MKLNDVLDLDCTKEENKKKLHDILKGLKPFAKYSELEEIPAYKIEKFVALCLEKYKIHVGYQIDTCRLKDGIMIWVMMVFKDGTKKNPIKQVYGMNINEAFEKLAIYLYFAYCKKGS